MATNEDFNRLNTLRTWLKDNDCYDIRACILQLGKSTRLSCEYKQDRIPPEHARNQSPYTLRGFYVMGDIPTKETVYYLYNGLTWYVSGYYQQDNVQYNDFHPFGHNFLLFPSIYEDILDKWDRVKMDVNYL